MRRFLSFWWLCARSAFGGNAAFANDWQWIFGNPVVSSFAAAAVAAVGALVPTVAKQFGATEMTTGMPALDGFLGALAAFVVTWLVAYMVRLFNAPVVLFHEQKSRADKLEGDAPTAPSKVKVASPIDKQMAALNERYLSGQPKASQREYLDHLVDGLKSIGDMQVLFEILTKETEVATKASLRARKDVAKVASNPEKQRHVVTKFAGELNSYANRVDGISNIVRHITPSLLEDTNKVVAIPALATEQDGKALERFIVAIEGNARSVGICIEAATGTIESIAKGFKGVSSDLNVASDRAMASLGELNKSFGDYAVGCTRIASLARTKAQDGKNKTHQTAI